MKRLTMCCVLMLLSCAVWAQLDVTIVDHPSEVLQYGPVLITVRVHNQGSEGVLVPASNFTSSSYFIETGATPDTLTRFEPIQSSGGGDSHWLPPGAVWLFQVDLGRWIHEPGPLFVAAGITSTGKCQYRPSGEETFPLTSVYRNRSVELYECWEGRSVSGTVAVEVIEPTSAVDLAARDYIQSQEYPFTEYVERMGLQFGVQGLRERFPTSHYTYAAGYYACDEAPDCIRELLELQPSHPLEPYMRQQLAIAMLKAGQAADLTDPFVEQLDLPVGLNEYVIQRINDREIMQPELTASEK